MIIKELVKKLLKRKRAWGFNQVYSTYAEAEKQCEGYDSDKIFNKVKKAALEVKNGNAVFERDGVSFNYKSTNYMLMMYMFQLVYQLGRPIVVLDFGGGTASAYTQHKEILKTANVVSKWYVVEQKHFVDFGRKELEDSILKFKYAIEDIDEAIDFVLLGSCLQYLPEFKPYMDTLLKRRPWVIYVERTTFSAYDDFYSIEEVHEPIYEASYATHIICKNKFIEYVEMFDYILQDDQLAQEGIALVDNKKIEFRTLYFKRYGCDIGQ